jgi:hypothetical protein
MSKKPEGSATGRPLLVPKSVPSRIAIAALPQQMTM